MSDKIPDSHVDLLTRPVIATLVTILPNGYPHPTPIWCDYDGEHILVNTAEGRQKDKDMQSNPRVAFSLFDPKDVYRWMEVRGEVVGRTLEGARDHIESLSQQYDGKPYFRDDAPAIRRSQTRVIYKVKPVKVTTNK